MGVLSSSDTGAWVHTDTGGVTSSGGVDQIPTMTAATTDGVTMSASSESATAWRAANDINSSFWETNAGVPQWLKIDFGADKTIATYSVRAASGFADQLPEAPRSWRLLGSAGGDATDTGTWTFLDSGGDQTGWALAEKRSFTIGSPAAYRYYGFFINQVDGGSEVTISEVELLSAIASGNQSHFNSVGLVLNAQSIGGLARVRQQVTVDTGNASVEHGLAINVSRGPVTIRVGSSANDDDYIEETALGTGRHSLSLTPTGDFYITFQSSEIVDRIVASLALESGGAVQLVGGYADTGAWEGVAA